MVSYRTYIIHSKKLYMYEMILAQSNKISEQIK